MKKNIKVSVVIPTYNYAHLLDETITSVLNQRFTDFELIIVDNQSTDNTEEVVKKYLSDSRVFYYKNEENLGLVGNWNKCIEYANGEYIKYLCADDKFHPDILSKFVAVMDEHPNVAIVSCHKQWFGDGIPPKHIGTPFAGLKSGREAIFYLLKADNYLGEPTLPMIRRSMLGNEKFNKDFKFIIDWEMWARILSKGDCYIIPEILCYTRKHLQRQTVIISNFRFKQSEEYYFFKSFLNGSSVVSFPERKKEIEMLVKKKAIVCAKEFYKLMPRYQNKASRPVIKEMLKIALEEKVLLRSIFNIHYKKKVAAQFRKDKSNPLLRM